MFKKYVICFLILSIVNFTGCYYSEVISKEDVKEGKTEINLNDELYLTTNDFTRYHFLPGDYYIAKDSLYGKGAIEASSTITPFKGTISLDEIINFEQNKPDTGATIGLIAGIIVVGALAVGIFVAAATDEIFNPD